MRAMFALAARLGASWAGGGSLGREPAASWYGVVVCTGPKSGIPAARDPASAPVSVIVPMRDEALHVDRCLDGLLGQDYAGEIEVLCVDGASADGTRDRVLSRAADDARVRLIDNPARVIPTALNLGLAAARHALVLRMDAHAEPAPDYVRRSVEVLVESGADCVGGRWETVGHGPSGEAIAAALTSPFGTGGAAWRASDVEADVDTVPYGLWRRAELLALGGFDEDLEANEDYELLYRLRARGGRVRFTPDVRAVYHSRRHLPALARQYLRYGRWKARVALMHPRSLRPRHLVAPAFVLALAVGVALALALGPPWTTLLAAGVAAWLAAALAASVAVARRTRWRHLPRLPLVFATLHLAWGAGFWLGLGGAGWRRRRPRLKGR